MRKGESDYLAEVRRYWIYAGWNGKTGDCGGKLCEKMSVEKAQKVWDRVSYAARVSAGIGPRQAARFLTEEKMQKARKIADGILRVIYENA